MSKGYSIYLPMMPAIYNKDIKNELVSRDRAEQSRCAAREGRTAGQDAHRTVENALDRFLGGILDGKRHFSGHDRRRGFHSDRGRVHARGSKVEAELFGPCVCAVGFS